MTLVNRSPMRIAYLTSQYPAPSHTFIAREVKELRRQGHDIQTFSVRPAGVTERGKQLDPTTFYLLPFRPFLYIAANFNMFAYSPVGYGRTLGLALKHRVPGIKALALAFAYFLESMLLADELNSRGVQHVHNHFANPSATVSMLATRFLGLTWSLTLHGNSETDYPAGNLLGAKLEMCDFAVCISNFGRAQAFRLIDPKHWHKLFISRCGIDLTQLPNVSPRISGAPLRVICVARFAPEKGHSGLLQAFSRARYAANCELVLVGDGPEKSRLKDEAKTLGIANCVIFKGSLPERETLREIALSDVLVLASFMEGLPVVLMEGMALGKPVIAPHIAGIPDMVQDGVNGSLFDPADWDSLTAALETILANRALRDVFSITGRQTIEERFDIRVAVSPLADRFLQLRLDAQIARLSQQVPSHESV